MKARLGISRLGILSIAGMVLGFTPANAAGVKDDLQLLLEDPVRTVEDYEKTPLPAGFQVVNTPGEGLVYADANGKTMYTWPIKDMRNGGYAGEQKGKPTCSDVKTTENAGLMSPYPGGLLLPDLDTRPSCTQAWPPVLAAADAKPMGNWTIVTGPGGRKQWAYNGFALYTSALDQKPGDTIGGKKGRGSHGAYREIAAPKVKTPAQFVVYPVIRGHLLGTPAGFSVYWYDKDAPNKSNCDAACLTDWSPVVAPITATAQGDWSIIENSRGVRQWAYRKKPLYTHISEERPRSYEGTDIPGWHNVYTMQPPPPPKGWTVTDMDSGQVLADRHGMTVYVYNCSDDSVDQLSCNHPSDTQVYRINMCGKGNVEKCLVNFPYVKAEKDEQGDGFVWKVLDIDPKTGHKTAPGAAGSMRVWAYRDRPIYSCARDQKPGDYECDAWGEFDGNADGFRAIWLRDDYQGNAG